MHVPCRSKSSNTGNFWGLPKLPKFSGVEVRGAEPSPDVALAAGPRGPVPLPVPCPRVSRRLHSAAPRPPPKFYQACSARPQTRQFFVFRTFSGILWVNSGPWIPGDLNSGQVRKADATGDLQLRAEPAVPVAGSDPRLMPFAGSACLRRSGWQVARMPQKCLKGGQRRSANDPEYF